jgi:hypothetical protein
MVTYKQKRPIAKLHQFRVKELEGDIISDLTRSKAAEIVIMPFSAQEEGLLTSKVDDKRQET